MIGQECWDLRPLLEKKPPKFRGHLRCPVCGSNRIYFKHALPFVRDEGQYRVDVAVKCASCALVMVFGVHVDREEFQKIRSAIGNQITYKQTGHVVLGGEGSGD